MYLFYSAFLTLWGLLLMPVFLYKAWRYNKYWPGLKQRLGYLPESLRSDGRPTVWIHSCSLGETLSVQPLAHALRERYPGARLVFSTITNTGQAIARKRFARFGEGNTFFFPIDLVSIDRRVLDWIRPGTLIIFDTEIWPNLIHEAHRRGIPVFLVNGRISEHSYGSYRLVRRVLRAVFRNYSLLLMKSEEDAERIRGIGAPADRVLVSGNLKYDRDIVEKEVREAQAASLDQAFGFSANPSPVIAAGSTHAGEEEILLEVFRRVRETPGLENTRLLLVPRHPERFDAVQAMAERAGFRVKRRSDETGSPEEAEVLLLDTVGELATVYRFATVVFVGGSLVPHGGQSVLEPAFYAKPILTGPSISSFPGITDYFLARGAALQVTAEELTGEFIRLLKDPQARQELGNAAYAILEENKGATDFTMEKIAPICGPLLSR